MLMMIFIMKILITMKMEILLILEKMMKIFWLN